MKKTVLIVAMFASFFALGMPDGAFGVAWPRIREEMTLPLNAATIMVIAHSVFYAATSSQIGRLATVLKLPNVNVLGLLILVIGMLGFAISPSFPMLVVTTMFLGAGMGMVDSGMNAFSAKHLCQRHTTWLHSLWGGGAATSPLIMTSMIYLASWRMGYVSIAVIQSIVLIFVIVTLVKGVWIVDSSDNINEKNEYQPLNEVSITTTSFLTRIRFIYLQVVLFILYVAAEYAITLWTTSVMEEARGLYLMAGIFPAIYLGFMTGGRIFAGFLKLSNTTIIRGGLVLALIGLVILTFTNSVIGIAFIGFGFAPVFPCLIHDTSRRFSPEALTKLVGYQVAGAGIGAAGGAFILGEILERVSLNALFPTVIVIVLIVFAINEYIESSLRKVH